MPRKYYPLTPSQKIHFKPIIEFGTQQVANISICMTLQAPLDFGLLKKMHTAGVRKIRMPANPFYKS